MFKRTFFGLLGLGAGVTLGVWAVRRADEARARLSPDHLARSAAGRFGSLGGWVAAAIEEGRAVAAAREAELRARHAQHRPTRAEEPQG